MSRAAEIAQRRPEDAQVRREAHEANATYRELTTRIVPKALRSMPIPVQRLTVLQGISGRSELEPMTVALNPEIHVRVLKGEARRKALAWLVEHGHAALAENLQGPFARKQQESTLWRTLLRGLADEQLDAANDLPWDTLGVTVKWIARFVRRF